MGLMHIGGGNFRFGDTALKDPLVLGGTKPAFDPASITSPNFNDTTLTVTGAKLGDHVLVSPLTSVPSGGLIWGFVNAADTVTIRFYGIAAAGAVDFASQKFNVAVLRLVRTV